MIELRRNLDLVEKPFGAQDSHEFGLQHLERDLALVLQVVRQVDTVAMPPSPSSRSMA